MSPSITSDMKVGFVMRSYPQTRDVFIHYGICDCCGGDRSILETALSKNLDVDGLLGKINDAL